MIIEDRTTKKQHSITPQGWDKIVAAGKKNSYKIIEAPELPKELKTVRPAKAEKAEFEINGITSNDDRLPKQDAGQVE